MAVLKYWDSTGGQWVSLLLPGLPGADGQAGPPGPTQVSADAGNEARVLPDGIYVAGTDAPIDQPTADARYVQFAVDTTITGALTVKAPSSAQHVATKSYTDGKVSSAPDFFTGSAPPTSGYSNGDYYMPT